MKSLNPQILPKITARPIKIKAEFISQNSGEFPFGIPSRDMLWKIDVLKKTLMPHNYNVRIYYAL